MLKEGVRLDRVRGGRQKYRRSTDPYTPVKTTALEGEFLLLSLGRSTSNYPKKDDFATQGLRFRSNLASLFLLCTG